MELADISQFIRVNGEKERVGRKLPPTFPSQPSMDGRGGCARRGQIDWANVGGGEVVGAPEGFVAAFMGKKTGGRRKGAKWGNSG